MAQYSFSKAWIVILKEPRELINDETHIDESRPDGEDYKRCATFIVDRYHSVDGQTYK